MATIEQVKEVSKHYLIACIWADCEEGTKPRATKAAQAKAFEHCLKFINDNSALFEEAINNQDYGWYQGSRNALAQFGHDFYLTRQGHGVGFWDRAALHENDLGRRLTEACKKAGEIYPEFYRGWLYLR